MRQHLPSHFFIFSAENPKYQVSASGQADNESVINHLKAHGEDAEHLHGVYDGIPEKSIIVKHPKNVKGLVEMARALGQESVIHSIDNSHELKYINGPKNATSVLGDGLQFYNEKPDGDHSIMHTDSGPVHFKINFKFPQEEPAAETKLNKSEHSGIDNLIHRIRSLEHNKRADMMEAHEHARETGHHNPKFFYHLKKIFGD